MSNEEGVDDATDEVSIIRSERYDVFISYGKDTGRNFTSNLYDALRHKRIKTFFFLPENDDGEQIPSSVLEAIVGSRTSIIVFSKNYAFSSRCLDELLSIIDCMKTNNQLVWPIFYKVDPSDTRNIKRGAYSAAMLKHEVRFGQDSMGVQKWRYALSKISNLNGWIYRETEYEYEFIQRIVESVVKSLPRFDVFLSFSGEDTRYSFTGFLYNALCQEGFKTFMDDEGLEGGNQISKTLLEAIEKTRLSIVVFSENYGYSSWCLDELVKIVECMKAKNQLVWPIFYKVKQSDVRNQTKSYGKAMIAHENKFGKDSEQVQKWRSALFEVASLEGEHIKNMSLELTPRKCRNIGGQLFSKLLCCESIAKKISLKRTLRMCKIGRQQCLKFPHLFQRQHIKENEFGEDIEEMQKSMSTQAENALLQAEHINENEYEYELIQKIVEKAIAIENHM